MKKEQEKKLAEEKAKSEKLKKELEKKEKEAEALKKKQKEEKKKNTSKSSSKSGSGASTSISDKYVGTYKMYYNLGGEQPQKLLTIAYNGRVVQYNQSWYHTPSFSGWASITSSGGTRALSYVTDQTAPTRYPGTKTITSDSLLTITWDNNGGSQTYYGYTSYSGRYVFTDGIEQGAGVHEVWVK